MHSSVDFRQVYLAWETTFFSARNQTFFPVCLWHLINDALFTKGNGTEVQKKIGTLWNTGFFFFCRCKLHSHYRGVARSWHDLNHSVCSVSPATAKQKDIQSANSTEQSQHRATHSPTRIKWAIFKNTPYKGLSRHQQKLQLCLDPAFHFQNAFLWAYMAKIWWLLVQCTYPYLLAWAAFPCSYWQKSFITLKARPPVPIWANSLLSSFVSAVPHP